MTTISPKSPPLFRSMPPSGSPANRLVGLEKLRAVVLMSGSVWPQPWITAIGRSVLDLPVEQDKSLLHVWVEDIHSLAKEIGAEQLAIRVVLCRTAPIPTASGSWVPEGITLRVERDTKDYRGTGGTLRDIAAHYDKDDFLLVAGAAQVLRESLTGLVRSLARAGGDAALLAHADGTPGSLILVRCGALSQIAPKGFVDLKEQALPSIASNHHVKVVNRPHAALMPIRTVADYLTAIRRHHRSRPGDMAAEPVETHMPAFRIVEPEARVDPTALLHDSVVLAGATVEPHALLIRSIVCEGTTIPERHSLIDRVATRHGPKSTSPSNRLQNIHG